MNESPAIALTLSEARVLAIALESAVVSIHRILSDESEVAPQDELRQYLASDIGWRQLSAARRTLAEALDRTLGPEEADHVTSDTEYWPTS